MKKYEYQIYEKIPGVERKCLGKYRNWFKAWWKLFILNLKPQPYRNAYYVERNQI